jgi:predicted transcriptional regulator
MFITQESKTRRTSVQIFSELLNASRINHVSKRDMLSAVNINYAQTKKYLDRLLELGMVKSRTEDNEEVWYLATEKGKRLLDTIECIQNLLHDPTKITHLD